MASLFELFAQASKQGCVIVNQKDSRQGFFTLGMLQTNLTVGEEFYERVTPLVLSPFFPDCQAGTAGAETYLTPSTLFCLQIDIA
jgi:hypothetical protein